MSYWIPRRHPWPAQALVAVAIWTQRPKGTARHWTKVGRSLRWVIPSGLVYRLAGLLVKHPPDLPHFAMGIAIAAGSGLVTSFAPILMTAVDRKRR